MGCGLDIGFIDHLYTPLETASNCSAIADLHSLQITTATTKPSTAYCVFNSRSLATASNSGDYSASRAHVVTVWRISCIQTRCQLSYQLQCHLFSDSFAELLSTANPQLNSLTHQPTTSLHFTSLHCTALHFTSLHSTELHSAGLRSSLYNLGADPRENNVSNSPSSVVMGSCLAIARISFTREGVYQDVAQKRPFVYLPTA
jgi:hypothetical protein